MYREQIDVRVARNKPLLEAGYSDAERLSCNVSPLVTSITWKSRVESLISIAKSRRAPDESISPKTAATSRPFCAVLIVPGTVAIVLVPCTKLTSTLSPPIEFHSTVYLPGRS
jgi:hypothetical protein